jgi:hypothetical protein
LAWLRSKETIDWCKEIPTLVAKHNYAAGSGAAAAPGQRAALAGPAPPPPPPPRLDPIDDLLPHSIGPLYIKIINDTAFLDRFGYLDLMAVCSRHQIGAFNAGSFCERSEANLVMSKGNALLTPRHRGARDAHPLPHQPQVRGV